MRVLDLFSGLGAFSLGLERSGGFETAAFCEIEPYCRRVLARHWPEVPCYDDVKTLTARRLAADGISVDAICGGFPCQDISYAGSGDGLAGDRSGLWFEFARLIGEVGPQVVVVENVAALLDRGMGVVIGTLSDLNGTLFPRAPWGIHTCDGECSLWPTPTASMDGRGFGIPLHERSGRYKRATVLRVHALVKKHGWRIHPNFTEALMDFPSGWSATEL